MPVTKQQVKRKTRVAKIRNANSRIAGRSKATESSACGRAQHDTDVSLVGIPCDDQSRREKLSRRNIRRVPVGARVTSVPVVSATGTPLMPTSPVRARKLIKSQQAKKRFRYGIFYLQLTEREDGKVQKVSCGIDPGSKREGFTVKSAKKTFINVLSDAKTTVKDKLETRRNMRRARRFRKTPCRKNRCNRKRGTLPPSVKARWQAKLRIVNILRKLYPISVYIPEDIKAVTKEGKGKSRWNRNFSPLESGKKWFYSELEKCGIVIKKQGIETAELRKKYGLYKTKEKLSEIFAAHNVDSWVLAQSVFDTDTKPDNTDLFRFIPIELHRRQLHRLQFKKGGTRPAYGSTRSLGITRGMVGKHNKYGYVYVGGNSKGRISLHDTESGERICKSAKPTDIKLMYLQKWRTQFLPCLKAGVPLRD